MSVRLINIPGTIKNYTRSQDEDGRSSRTAATPFAVKCRIDSLGAQAVIVGSSAEEQTRWRALIRSDQAPTFEAELESRGVTYDVIGHPWAVTDHRGRHHHYEANVRKR